MRIKVSLIAMAVLALVSIGSAQQGQGGGGQGRRQGGMRGMGGGGAMRLTQLLRMPQVQEELKLTDDEKAKVEALPGMGRPGGGGPGGGGPGGGGQGGGQRGGRAPMTPEAMAKQYADDKAATSAILTPEQEKRLEELRVQWAGPAAVAQPDVQDALGLSADQKAKITDLQTKMAAANRALMEKVQSGETDRQEAMTTMQANTATMRTELDKVLTDDQKAKLKALGGAELKMEPMRRPGGGGGQPPRA